MTDINLGTIITNGTARRIIYGTYVIALIVVGAIQVGFTDPDPEWVTNTFNVLTYLGIPVGTLALANTSTRQPVSQEALNAAVKAETELQIKATNVAD